MLKAERKLNKIKKDDWDDSALIVFDQWKEQLRNLELDKNYLELPQSRAIAEFLVNSLRNSNKELVDNRYLTEVQRLKLFALKDIAESLLPRFSLEDNLKQISLIEEEINNA